MQQKRKSTIDRHLIQNATAKAIRKWATQQHEQPPPVDRAQNRKLMETMRNTMKGDQRDFNAMTMSSFKEKKEARDHEEMNIYI